jgi:integrase/recombinase XerD
MVVTVSKNEAGKITVSFPYDPQLVVKVKTIEGRKWHKDKKYWSFPESDGIIEKILKVFEGEEIQKDPVLHAKNIPSPLVGEGKGEGVFEDLRRELVSRKYSYKTVKGYLYYNRDFLSFIGKGPFNITEEDIKELPALPCRRKVEEKQSATSTLNQAINALKFYYGTMLKKKFVYEVKRPRKDKKLPIVLSKEEVADILSSVDNIKHKAILMLVYSAGLRVGKVVRLKPEDIDSKRMLIHIKGSKGRKDRYTMLSVKALQILRQYWKK